MIRSWWMILSLMADVAFPVLMACSVFRIADADETKLALCMLIFIKLQAGVGMLINHINKEGGK